MMVYYKRTRLAFTSSYKPLCVMPYSLDIMALINVYIRQLAYQTALQLKFQREAQTRRVMTGFSLESCV